MFGLGFGELSIVLIIVVLLFGAKKLPALGGSLGSAIKNFKKGLDSSEDAPKEIEDKDNDKPA